MPPANRRRARLVAGLVGLAVVLGVLTCLEVRTELLRPVDVGATSWLLGHRPAWLTSLARTVTDTGTSPLLYPLVAAAGLLVWVRTGRWAPGLAAFLVVVAGVLSRLGLSRIVRDARPPAIDRLVPVHGFSFPSGHAATSALVAGALSVLLWPVLRSSRARVAMLAAVSVQVKLLPRVVAPATLST